MNENTMWFFVGAALLGITLQVCFRSMGRSRTNTWRLVWCLLFTALLLGANYLLFSYFTSSTAIGLQLGGILACGLTFLIAAFFYLTHYFQQKAE
ncbi:MAG: hypothetical protein Q4D50_11180 [Eubacteriales bacterium]|nr:hypothetical protein [Eubacteriales bacterium]